MAPQTSGVTAQRPTNCSAAGAGRHKPALSAQAANTAYFIAIPSLPFRVLVDTSRRSI